MQGPTNPGMPLDLEWVRRAEVNLPALIRRAETHTKRRSVKKAWQVYFPLLQKFMTLSGWLIAACSHRFTQGIIEEGFATILVFRPSPATGSPLEMRHRPAMDGGCSTTSALPPTVSLSKVWLRAGKERAMGERSVGQMLQKQNRI